MPRMPTRPPSRRVQRLINKGGAHGPLKEKRQNKEAEFIQVGGSKRWCDAFGRAWAGGGRGEGEGPLKGHTQPGSGIGEDTHPDKRTCDDGRAGDRAAAAGGGLVCAGWGWALSLCSPASLSLSLPVRAGGETTGTRLCLSFSPLFPLSVSLSPGHIPHIHIHLSFLLFVSLPHHTHSTPVASHSRPQREPWWCYICTPATFWARRNSPPSLSPPPTITLAPSCPHLVQSSANPSTASIHAQIISLSARASFSPSSHPLLLLRLLSSFPFFQVAVLSTSQFIHARVTTLITQPTPPIHAPLFHHHRARATVASNPPRNPAVLPASLAEASSTPDPPKTHTPFNTTTTLHTFAHNVLDRRRERAPLDRRNGARSWHRAGLGPSAAPHARTAHRPGQGACIPVLLRHKRRGQE